MRDISEKDMYVVEERRYRRRMTPQTIDDKYQRPLERYQSIQSDSAIYTYNIGMMLLAKRIEGGTAKELQ